MSRIITRGLGPSHLLCTRGYMTTAPIREIYREFIRDSSALGITLRFVSELM